MRLVFSHSNMADMLDDRNRDINSAVTNSITNTVLFSILILGALSHRYWHIGLLDSIAMFVSWSYFVTTVIAMILALVFLLAIPVLLRDNKKKIEVKSSPFKLRNYLQALLVPTLIYLCGHERLATIMWIIVSLLTFSAAALSTMLRKISE